MTTTFIQRIVFLLVFVFSLTRCTLFAQGKCGTTEAMQELIKQDPSILERQQALEVAIQEEISSRRPGTESVGPVYIIPIVFHVLHMYGSENISDGQIQDAVNILNRDYRKLNTDTAAVIPYFKPFAADCEIEFRLATKDPNGNCTNGIDRIYTHKTIGAGDGSKLNQWDPHKYLNVWVVRSIGASGVAGYAYYPSAVNGVHLKKDGIIILSTHIGSTGTGSAYNSRSLTHEIGHYLNLSHPWGDNNSPGAVCGDDYVNDTPITKGSVVGVCNLYDYTCDSQPLSSSSYGFANVTTTSGTTDPTPPITLNDTNDTGVIYGSFTAAGVSANSVSAGKFDFTGWGIGGADGDTAYANQTGSIDLSKYYEFTVTPTDGNGVKLTAITFAVSRNSTGARTFAVRSSVNNFASNLPASVVLSNTQLSVRTGNIFYIKDTTNSLSGSAITLTGTPYTTYNPVTFRIYAWNAEDVAGSFSIDNVNIAGTYGVIENVQNFMDYSYCSKMYSEGQKTRMRITLNVPIAHRNNLWSASNLVATGTDTPPAQACVPEADFYANRYFVCEGAGIGFYGLSKKATATNWEWSFPGGNPSSSTSQILNVTYNTPSWKEVSLKVSNASGNSTTTRNDYVYVSPLNPDFQGNYSDGFESQGSFNNYWIPVNTGHNASQWKLSPAASYTGSSAVSLNAFSPANIYYFENPPIVIDPGIAAYDVDNLITPALDMSWVSSTSMSFRLAYASAASSANDITETLKIYYSLNCGQTWTATSYSKTGTNLVTAGHRSVSYVPGSLTDWRLETVSLPAVLNNKSNVRFMFEYTSGEFSNNLYIDDFAITGTVGVEDELTNSLSMNVFPNPTNGNTNLSYYLDKPQNVDIEITDMLGQKVMALMSEYQVAGEKSVVLPTENLEPGVYFVRIISDKKLITGKKLIISN